VNDKRGEFVSSVLDRARDRTWTYMLTEDTVGELMLEVSD